MKILTVVKKTGENFIRHYLPYFPEGSKVAYSADQAFSMIPHFDIILFEWANDLASQIINSKQFQDLQSQLNFKTVVRIHDHEVRKIGPSGRRIDHIKWERVNKIWFINRIIQKQFHELKGVEQLSFYLPNAIDVDSFIENQADTKRVGLVSLYFRQRKRIDRVIEIAKLLPDWEFHVRVEIPNIHSEHEFSQCFREFQEKGRGVDNVIVQDRKVVPVVKAGYESSDLKKWYKDKAVILSTSDWEGFHYSIGEGMALGCMPVVWNWPSAKDFWEPFVVNSAEEAAEKISQYKPSSIYREYVTELFGSEELASQLLEKINTHE